MYNFMSSQVSVVKHKHNLKEDIHNCLDRSGGIKNYIKPGNQVFIKPNLTAGALANSGGTTDVKFVQTLIRIIKEIPDITIIVGEGAGNEIDTDVAFERLGYKELCEQENVLLYNCDKSDRIEIILDDYLYKSSYLLPEKFIESDIFINVPSLKTHDQAGITVAMKNMFGLISDQEKIKAHRDNAIEKCLVDLNKIKPADLIVVDGIMGAEGVAGGTDFDHPIKADLILAGNDPVAVDVISAKLMAQSTRIRYLYWAQQQGIGISNPDYINYYGPEIDETTCRFMSPGEQLSQEIKNLHIYNLNSCSGCRGRIDSVAGRYAEYAFLKETAVFYGPGKCPESKLNDAECVFLVGDCIREEYREKGIWLPGCPPQSNEFSDLLKKENILCNRCDDVAEMLLKIILDNNDALKIKPYLRVLAGGKDIFRGKKYEGKMTDYIITVGDCQQGYIRNHRNRIRKLIKIDPDKYCKHIAGCPPEEEDLYRSLKQFLNNLDDSVIPI